MGGLIAVGLSVAVLGGFLWLGAYLVRTDRGLRLWRWDVRYWLREECGPVLGAAAAMAAALLLGAGLVVLSLAYGRG